MAYFSGGYYLVRPAGRSEDRSPELLPDRLISISGCICEAFPDAWTIDWVEASGEDRARLAAGFGITNLAAAMAWATEAFSKSFGWPNAFYTLEAAREARARFLPESAGVVTIGLGLHESHADCFLEAAAPPPQVPGCAPAGETGVYQCVRARTEIAAGGTAAGFELVAVDLGMFTCSWLCNGLENDCATELSVRPNARGFVDTHEDALRCGEWIAMPETGAEPGLWLPWLVTIYDEALPQ